MISQVCVCVCEEEGYSAAGRDGAGALDAVLDAQYVAIRWARRTSS